MFTVVNCEALCFCFVCFFSLVYKGLFCVSISRCNKYTIYFCKRIHFSPFSFPVESEVLRSCLTWISLLKALPAALGIVEKQWKQTALILTDKQSHFWVVVSCPLPAGPCCSQLWNRKWVIRKDFVRLFFFRNLNTRVSLGLSDAQRGFSPYVIFCRLWFSDCGMIIRLVHLKILPAVHLKGYGGAKCPIIIADHLGSHFNSLCEFTWDVLSYTPTKPPKCICIPRSCVWRIGDGENTPLTSAVTNFSLPAVLESWIFRLKRLIKIRISVWQWRRDYQWKWLRAFNVFCWSQLPLGLNYHFNVMKWLQRSHPAS